MRRLTVTATTAADGTATVFSPRVSGKLHSIQYVKSDFPNGVGFAITAEATGENLWTEAAVNASAVRYPRAATHSQAGAAALYASAGTAVADKIGIGNDRVKIAITAGGNAKSGTFHILID